MTDAVFSIQTAGGRREVPVSACLDAELQEQAVGEANAWIKSLRHARVDGESFRHRFSYRGDSLWWFTELYLHKQQTIAGIFRTILALDRLIERERPPALRFVRGGGLAHRVARALASARGLAYEGPDALARPGAMALAAMDARATAITVAAHASRLRERAPLPRRAPAHVAAFVHRAFWRSEGFDGSAEAYIGPVLVALETRLDPDALAYVTVGPATNFRARRWWHAFRQTPDSDLATRIEAYAPTARLEGSRQVWRERHRMRRALWKSPDLRERAVIRGCDCWSIVREELAGVALLQWPWSARAMDEAGAALDALQPRVAVTYAEAGGWGRALILESRRRGIPSAGLQHGFIYRHWLNYQHAPDELQPDPDRPAEAGYPFPTLTLLFDGYAARQLTGAGQLPESSLAVTGSPRLDALANEIARLAPADVDRARADAGAATDLMVLVAAKYKEAPDALASFLDAAQSLPDVHVAIKTHPAETPEVYHALVAGRPRIEVLEASRPLAPLLCASRAVVTVNSTVALDAAVLDIPALVVGLPTNLTPFVDAGIMAGAGAKADEIAEALERILYDEEFRRELSLARRDFLNRYNIGADGRAAERSADAILGLIAGRDV